MDAKTFLDKYPTAEAERVANEAGTNLAYFRQIAYGVRVPSRKLARRLERSSGGRMTAYELLFPPHEDTPKKAGNGGG